MATSDPYPWTTPPPSLGGGASTGDNSMTNWNQAWNEGYNNSTGGNPYTGFAAEGYAAGQAKYHADYAALHPTPQPGPAPTTPPPPAGTILDAGTGPVTPPTNNNDAALAQSSYDIAQGRIRDLFNTGNAQADTMQATGQNRLQDILNAVDAFKTEALQQKTNSGQEITNAASDIMHGNAVTARDLVGKSTGQARSLGLGLSSRLNLGQGLLQGLESTQGNTMAKAGEQNRANDIMYNQRLDTGNTTAGIANTNFNDLLGTINNFKTSNLASYGTNSNQAGSDFAGMLNNITNYNRSLTAMAAPSAGSLLAMQPDMTGINNQISSFLSSMPSTSTVGTGANAPLTLASPSSSFQDLLNPKKKIGTYWS